MSMGEGQEINSGKGDEVLAEHRSPTPPLRHPYDASRYVSLAIINSS